MWQPLTITDRLKDMSDDEIKDAFRRCVEETVVVFKDQDLSPEDELRVCSVVGNIQPTLAERSKDISEIQGIIRVTGQKNERGQPGLFGHKSALDWHANQPSNEERHPLIWLYGVQGTKGSRTSYINMIDAYNDLDEKLKFMADYVYFYCGYKKGTYSESEFHKEHVSDVKRKLVHTNEAIKTGLFFPYLQIMEWHGPDIKEELIEHVMQDKYTYHHDWDDGDVVIAEQWLGIHKRWPFEKMEERILHRIALDHSCLY
jgi:alpha-ketoglutarate-dependent taurine dioxygenase